MDQKLVEKLRKAHNLYQQLFKPNYGHQISRKTKGRPMKENLLTFKRA